MSADELRPFRKFLARAHGQRVAWRLIEHAAMGLLIGCAIAAIILAVAWWREIDAVAPVIAIMFVSSVAGIVASVWRRPMLIDTARLIETQLDSPELISSAMLASTHGDRTFINALHALADARVAGVTPSSLALRRFGSRAWSGVGLASASVLILALMISSPITDREAVAKSSDSIDAWPSSRMESLDRQLPPSVAPGERGLSRDPTSSNAMTNAMAKASHETPPLEARPPNGTSNAAKNSRGGGSANSDSTASDSPIVSRSSSRWPNSGTLIAGGAGAASSSGITGENSSGIVGGASSSAAVAPWLSDSWPHDRESALNAIHSGAVPDSYRALVQDYFQRP